MKHTRWLLAAGLLALVLSFQSIPARANGVGTVYIASESAKSVSVLDSNTNAVIQTISLDYSPVWLAFSPDTHFVYVTHPNSNVISLIDTTIEDVAATIRVGSQVSQIAVTSGGAWLLATDPIAGQLHVIDTAKRQELFAISVGGAPDAIAASTDGNTAYVTDASSGALTTIDLRKREVSKTAQLSRGAHYLALSPTARELMATAVDGGDIQVMDTATGALTRTLPGGPTLGPVGFSPTGDVVYLARGNRNGVLSLNNASGTEGAFIQMPYQPSGFGVARDGKKGYASIKETNKVAVIDLARMTVSAEITVEKGPTTIAVSPIQSKPEPVVMPSALPNTGGQTPASGMPWQPIAIGTTIVLMGSAGIVIGSRLLGRR